MVEEQQEIFKQEDKKEDFTLFGGDILFIPMYTAIGLMFTLITLYVIKNIFYPFFNAFLGFPIISDIVNQYILPYLSLIYDYLPPWFDAAIFLEFILLYIIAFLLSLRVQINPLYLGIAVILAPFFLYIAYVIMYSLSTYVFTTMFSEEFSKFTLTKMLIDNFPEITSVLTHLIFLGNYAFKRLAISQPQIEFFRQ